jgi:cysteinyl-tRNA synthetase
MKTLKLYNSLSRQKEEFRPLNPNLVRIYACGPTVYSYAHIGNARMAVVFDLLRNVMEHLYPNVLYASNITDVDDKIMAAAAETGEAIDHITRKYEKIYNENMAWMGVRAPDIQPRATEHIPEMIKLIQALIDRGHAYVVEGHVAFHVPSFPKYGELSGRSYEEQKAGSRVEVAPYKKDPADFILWKPSAPDQVGWESPWGRGRPGWHIECSAMTEKHLGLPFDIHGGGADLKFPHHENEIAQSCCAHGQEHDLSAFAKYWVHNGFVTVNGEKMSKSLGNVVLAQDLIEKNIKGEIVRFVLLSGHYRQPLDWTDDAVHQAQKNLDRLYTVLYELKDIEDIEVQIPESFLEALYDDLNTPKAYAELNALAREALQQKTSSAKAAFRLSAQLMGFLKQDPAQWLGFGQDDEIEKLLNERSEAKKAKNFARADQIRDELKSRGIEIEDTPQGPKWRKLSLG